MFWRHEQLSLQVALADALHHSAQPRAWTGAPAASDAATQTMGEFFAHALPVYGAPAPTTPMLFDFLKPLVPIAQVVQVHQVQLTEKIVESPEIQSAQDTQTSVSLGSASSRRVTFAGTLARGWRLGHLSLPNLSPMHVTTPVVDVPPLVEEYVRPDPLIEFAFPAPAVSSCGSCSCG